MSDRRPLFLDTDTGLLTETGGTNTIDLAAMPWLESLIYDVARCRLALRLLDVDIDDLDVGDLALPIGV